MSQIYVDETEPEGGECLLYKCGREPESNSRKNNVALAFMNRESFPEMFPLFILDRLVSVGNVKHSLLICMRFLPLSLVSLMFQKSSLPSSHVIYKLRRANYRRNINLAKSWEGKCARCLSSCFEYIETSKVIALSTFDVSFTYKLIDTSLRHTFFV